VTGHDRIGGGENPLAARLERGLVLASGSTSGVRSVCHQAWIQATTPSAATPLVSCVVT
jgi:hypothetical protein